MITGTNHFASKLDAYLYYKPYGYCREDIDDKVYTGEIKIGHPILHEGEECFLNVEEGRYFIRS
jgi:hypothetical protein